MGRDPKTQAGVADRAQVRRFQVLLAQMHAVGLMLNGQLPVVVDKQPGMILTTERDSGDHIVLNVAVALIFDAQLKGTHAGFQQALNPYHAINNRIEA